MDLSKPLAIITPTVDAAVLAVLAGARTSFTGRQIHQIAGQHSERGVRNALQRLCMHGIVTRERVGASNLYALNRSHLAAPYIEALAGLRDELISRITETLASWSVLPVFGAMFGSAARGDMHIDSDIDLFVVRPRNVDAGDPRWSGQLADLAGLVTGWTGNDARVLEFGEDEVGAGLATGERVLVDIRAQGVILFGETAFLDGSRLQKGKVRSGKREKVYGGNQKGPVGEGGAVPPGG